MLILRLIHILAGIFWAGSAFFLASFIMPTAKALGSGAGPFMQHLLVQRRLTVSLLTAAALTVLSGLGMFWHDTALSGGEFPQTHAGMAYSIGAVAALIAATIGATVSRPTGARMVALMTSMRATAGAPLAEQQAEMGALGKRMGMATHSIAGLVGIAAAMMAAARYL